VGLVSDFKALEILFLARKRVELQASLWSSLNMNNLAFRPQAGEHSTNTPEPSSDRISNLLKHMAIEERKISFRRTFTPPPTLEPLLYALVFIQLG